MSIRIKRIKNWIERCRVAVAADYQGMGGWEKMGRRWKEELFFGVRCYLIEMRANEFGADRRVCSSAGRRTWGALVGGVVMTAVVDPRDRKIDIWLAERNGFGWGRWEVCVRCIVVVDEAAAGAGCGMNGGDANRRSELQSSRVVPRQRTGRIPRIVF